MDKLKDGVSVKELENFARRYMTEGFLILAIIIATLSSIFDFFTGAGWSVFFAGLGIIVSVAFPEHILKMIKPLNQFIKKQEKTVQIIVGIVRLIFAIFIPFIIFAEAGLLAGLAYHKFPHDGIYSKENEKKEEKIDEHDEEHL
jgi:CBS domain containing-hemolysin-like protein